MTKVIQLLCTSALAVVLVACGESKGAIAAEPADDQITCELSEIECSLLGTWAVSPLPEPSGFFDLLFETQSYEMDFRANHQFYGETRIKNWQVGDEENFSIIDVQQIGRWALVDGELRIFDLSVLASIDRSAMSAEQRDAEIASEEASGESYTEFFEERYSTELRGLLNVESNDRLTIGELPLSRID